MKSLVTLLLITLTFSISNSQTYTFKLGFTGAYPNYFDTTTKDINWSYYSELNLNTIQGWWVSDNPFGLEVLGSLNTNSMDGYFQPDTLRWAGYGRMQVYEAESNTSSIINFGTHWCGTNVQDNTQWGYGQYVRYFNKNAVCDEDNPAGTVLSGVSENAFQSLSALPYDPMYQIPFPGDGHTGTGYLNKYYIKPRMRIDSLDADSDPPKDVVKIIVKAYDGTIVNQTTIRTNDFVNNGIFYNGAYIEDYLTNNSSVNGDVINSNRPSPPDPNKYLGDCQVDYQIYWFGTVSVWIDYVKVMDEPANKLFNTNSTQNLDSTIAGKVSRLSTGDAGGRMQGFYMEEVDYSNIACLKKMNEKLALYSGGDTNYKMTGLINPGTFQAHLHNQSWDRYDDYIDSVKPSVFMTVAYPFTGTLDQVHPWKNELPHNLDHPLCLPTDRFNSAAISDIQAVYSGGAEFSSTNAIYNDSLQPRLQNYSGYVQLFNTKSKAHKLNMYYAPQTIFWHEKSSDFWMREPTNQEIGAEIGIGLCNGAKGIMPYAYESWRDSAAALNFRGGTGEMYSTGDQTGYTYSLSVGVSDFDISHRWGYAKRDSNFYHQPKWSYLKTLYGKIKKWGPILANTNSEGYSVSNDGSNHNFINDIKSIYRNSSAPYDFNPSYEDGAKYWEEGFFTGSTYVKYLMMVNRRCVPEIAGGDGDIRQLKVKFNGGAELPVYSNWKVTDMYTGQTVVTIDKNSDSYYSLGSFDPGEAKLFKLTPVLQSGGTFVTNEEISGESFTCEDTVWTGGYNMYFKGNGNTISFSDSALIVMSGGTFQSDSASHGPQTTKNTFQSAVSGHKWAGLKFEGCNVKIYNSSLSGVNSPAGGNFAVSSVDCPLTDIRYNTFTSSSDTAGGVSIAYTTTSFVALNAYIMYNTFTMNSSFSRGIQVQGFAGQTTGVYIEHNTMTSSGNASGIMLSTITGGVIKSNSITGFATGINTILSSCDLYGNTISNTSSASTGMLGTGLSSLNMVPSGTTWLAGLNLITNTSGSSINVEVNNSVFIIDGGKNTFDVSSSGSPYHLHGSFWNSSYNTRGRNNCFELSGSAISNPTAPNNYVTDSAGSSQVSLSFTYLCGGTPPAGTSIVDIGNGLYDTIPVPDGYGGGESGIGQRLAFDVPVNLTPGQIYDSLRVQLRHKNYSIVKNLCYELIDNYPDSAETVESLQTLYMVSNLTDTTTTGKTALKTYYENLILNHGTNAALVEISNYLTQKCKVLLRQYSSALTGFQQIIDNNEYSYEGLIARWDYMATSLLMNGGSGGVGMSDVGFDLPAAGRDSDLKDKEGDLSPYRGEIAPMVQRGGGYRRRQKPFHKRTKKSY